MLAKTVGCSLGRLLSLSERRDLGYLLLVDVSSGILLLIVSYS